MENNYIIYVQIIHFMTEANVLFLYDVYTLEVLGFSVFEGNFKRGYLSEDKKSLVMEVDSYRFLPFKGSIVPMIKNGVMHVRIYEILSGCDSVAIDTEIVRFHCGSHPLDVIHRNIPKFAEKARSEVERLNEQAKRQAEQLAKQLTLMVTMLPSSPPKWSS